MSGRTVKRSKKNEAEDQGNRSQTLYVSNINDHVHRDAVRQLLYHLFSAYGRILDIVMAKKKSMKGQAHVVMGDVRSATRAMQQLRGFVMLGKPIKIEYSTNKSTAVALLDGTYVAKEFADELKHKTAGGDIDHRTDGSDDDLPVYENAEGDNAL